MNKIIIAIIIILIVGGIGIAIYFSVDTNKFPFGKENNGNGQRGDFNPENMERPPGNFTPGEFQIDESVKEEIILFFDSSPSEEEIETYCKKNRMYCMYYCMEIDPENNYCENMYKDRTPPERIGNPPK